MPKPFAYKELHSKLLPLSANLLRVWLPDGIMRGQEYIARNPKRPDKKLGSFKINTASGRWADFATGDSGGDIISLVAYLRGIRQREAAELIQQVIGGGYGKS